MYIRLLIVVYIIKYLIKLNYRFYTSKIVQPIKIVKFNSSVQVLSFEKNAEVIRKKKYIFEPLVSGY